MSATTTNFTVDQYNALSAAIAEGVKTVKYSDKEVTYHDLDEMLKLRELMKNEIWPECPTTNGVVGRRRRVAVYHSGHYPPK